MATGTMDLERGAGRPRAGRAGAAPHRLAMVLVGGAARGAYEVGVVHYLLDDVARALGRDLAFDVFSGTSIGAVNACFLAAFADEPRTRARRLAAHWEQLRLADMLKPDACELLSMLAGRARGRHRAAARRGPRGGIVSSEGFERLLRSAIPFERIHEHIRSGRLAGVSVSTTHVGSGRAVVFVDCETDGRLPLALAPPFPGRLGPLRIEHALASASIPLLFPAVRIDGELHCDGGLRQNVPLSPARHLGAEGMVVVNPHPAASPASKALAREREEAFGPVYLVGKALSALMLDHIGTDIDRMAHMNELLTAGCARYGPEFVDELNRSIGARPGRADLRVLPLLVVRASEDLSRIAADFVRSPAFARRATGPIAFALRALAEAEGVVEDDLLSYLLLDGEYAGRLMELGRADARARHDELCRFFERMAAPAESRGEASA